LTEANVSAFSEILPFFGVDASTCFMTVPVGGFNLIYHNLGKDVSFSVNTADKPDNSSLVLKDVTEAIRQAPDVARISKNSKQPLFVDDDDMKTFLTSASKGLTSDPSQRLLAVTANAAGVHTLTLKGPKRSEALTIWALKQRPVYKIAFRFVKYAGDWPPPGSTEKTLPNYSKGVARGRDDGIKYGRLLIQYYRHMANTPVVLQGSEDLGLRTPFGPKAKIQWYVDTLVPGRDKSADSTIFIVPYGDGFNGLSEIAIDPTHGIMVAENPTVVWAGEVGDSFQMVSTHELGHALGAHHKTIDGALMADENHKQGFVLDQDSLREINAPSRR
jgi:hypothetical protein